MRTSSKTSCLIRLFASAYLIYLSIRMMRNLIDSAAAGKDMALTLVAFIGFMAISVVLIITSIQNLVRISKEQKAEEEAEEEEQEKLAETLRIEKEQAKADPAYNTQTDRQRSIFAAIERASAITAEELDEEAPVEISKKDIPEIPAETKKIDGEAEPKKETTEQQ